MGAERESVDDLAYYRYWVHALEWLLQEKQLFIHSTLQSAAEATLTDWPHPDHHAHRQPIAISPPRVAQGSFISPHRA
jgi:hypothetical protein